MFTIQVDVCVWLSFQITSPFEAITKQERKKNISCKQGIVSIIIWWLCSGERVRIKGERIRKYE